MQPEKTTPTRDRLIEAAGDLFLQRGIHCVGLGQVLKRVGITKTTFYKYFDSKDSLAQAVLRRRSEWELQQFREALSEEYEVGTAHFSPLFEVLNGWFLDRGYRGCPLNNAAAEFPEPTDPLHRVAAEHKTALLRLVEERAERAGLQSSSQLADEVLLVVEGATSVRQVLGDRDAAKTAARIASTMIDAAYKAAEE
ncbi:HTH-type transcriptional regulator YjdC [Planctomycetes bacterium MalM25]|nr:HTH-type transcriptional regulator YjdC [Planctomycetes bacterium MalM25]